MQPSALCQRCSEYNIVKVFREAMLLDPAESVELNNMEYSEYLRRLSQYEMPLGLLSSLHLTPPCPLCRLIYRVLPRRSLDPNDRTMKITPFRTYEREAGWETIPSEFKAQYAILLGLNALHYMNLSGSSYTPGGANIRF
jgi:hypothetical protein